MRILHLEPKRFAPEVRALIEALGPVDYVDDADTDQARRLLASTPYDAVFTRLGIELDAAALAGATSLRFIVTPTTGLDHIDLEAAATRGIEVVSLKGQVHLLDTVASTAELTWALLLAAVRRLPAAHTSVVGGVWARDAFVGTELRGRTLGIVGCGRLGRMVAGYGLAFGMDVLVHDHDPAAIERAPDGARSVGLDELLTVADVVSVHLPLDDTTAGFIGRERLEQMKPGAVFVNTARGELVDEAALVDLLDAGRIGAVGVDVVADDSRWPGVVPDDQPLVARARRQDNIVITPHIGGYGRDAIDTTRRFIAERFVARVHSGEPEGSTP